MKGIATQIRAILTPFLLALAIASCGGSDGDGGPVNNMAAEDNQQGTQETVVIEEPIPAVEQPLALHDAERAGLVEYQVTGTGNSSGDSLRIRVRRTTSRPVTLYIAPGTVFGTRSAGVQRMVAWSVSGSVVDENSGLIEPTETIHLDDDRNQEFVVEAYCMDIELENPSSEDEFAARSVDQRAAAILSEANGQGLGLAATQAAIWMDQGVTGDEIVEKFEATQEELEQARQLLTRLPPRT